MAALQPDQHARPVAARGLRRGRPLQPLRDRPVLLRQSSASDLSGPAPRASDFESADEHWPVPTLALDFTSAYP